MVLGLSFSGGTAGFACLGSIFECFPASVAAQGLFFKRLPSMAVGQHEFGRFFDVFLQHQLCLCMRLKCAGGFVHCYVCTVSVNGKVGANLSD